MEVKPLRHSAAPQLPARTGVAAKVQAAPPSTAISSPISPTYSPTSPSYSPTSPAYSPPILIRERLMKKKKATSVDSFTPPPDEIESQHFGSVNRRGANAGGGALFGSAKQPQPAAMPAQPALAQPPAALRLGGVAARDRGVLFGSAKQPQLQAAPPLAAAASPIGGFGAGGPSKPSPFGALAPDVEFASPRASGSLFGSQQSAPSPFSASFGFGSASGFRPQPQHRSSPAVPQMLMAPMAFGASAPPLPPPPGEFYREEHSAATPPPPPGGAAPSAIRRLGGEQKSMTTQRMEAFTFDSLPDASPQPPPPQQLFEAAPELLDLSMSALPPQRERKMRRCSAVRSKPAMSEKQLSPIETLGYPLSQSNLMEEMQQKLSVRRSLVASTDQYRGEMPQEAAAEPIIPGVYIKSSRGEIRCLL